MTEIARPAAIPEQRVRARARHPELPSSQAFASWVTVAAAMALVVIPLAALLRESLALGVSGLLRIASTASDTMMASASTSITATVVAVSVGTMMALLTERSGVPGRRWVRLAMFVAFIVPGYVAALGWQAAYAPGGLLDDVIGLAAPALLGPVGIVVVLAAEAMPLAYLVVAAALATQRTSDLERAARASGAGSWDTLRTITLPMVGPAVAAAAALSFVLSVTSFGVPAVLGIPAGFSTMTTRIYRDLALSADPESFTRAVGLAIVLAAVVGVAVVIADRLLGRGGTASAASVVAGPARAHGFGPQGAEAGSRFTTLVGGVVVWSVAVMLVLLPLLGLTVTALARAPGLAPQPGNWSLDNFAAVLDDRLVDALGRSLVLSTTAAATIVLLSLVALLARRGSRSGMTGSLASLSLALPGSTLAVAMLLAYGVALRDTLLIILVAYVAKFWALGFRPIAAGLESVPADQMRAARASGAGRLTAARTIALPLLRPVVVAGAIVVFIFGLHEVTMSSLLYGPGSATLSVVVLNLQQLGDAGLTAAMALLLSVIIATIVLPLLRFVHRIPGAGAQP